MWQRDPGRRACPGAGSGWRLKKRATGECLTPTDRRLTLATPRCGILVDLLLPQSETPTTFGHRYVVDRLPVGSTDRTTHRFVIPVKAARTAGGANATPGRHAD